MFRSTIKRTIPIVATAVWLMQAWAAGPAPTRNYRVSAEPRPGCPIEIVEALVVVRPSRSEVVSGTEETTYDVTLRNASRKKVVYVSLQWSGLASGSRPVQDEIVSYLPGKRLKPQRTWQRVTAAPDPAAEVERFSVVVARVRFADHTVWPVAEPLTAILELAEVGDVEAQYELGKMYRDGREATLDPVTAYVWFHLAVLGGHDTAREARDELAATLTPEEIDEALWLAKKRTWFQFIERFKE